MELTLIDLHDVVPPIKKGLELNNEAVNNLSNNITSLENKLNDFEEKITNIERKLNNHENKLKNMDIKLQDFNIVELLKANAGDGGGDTSVALSLISSLEKKIMAKVDLLEERFTKTDEVNFKKNKEIQNIKNSQDLNKRNINSNKKEIDIITEEKIPNLESNLNNILNEVNTKLTEKISQIEKYFNDEITKIQNIQKNQKPVIIQQDKKPTEELKKINENLKNEFNGKIKEIQDQLSEDEKLIKNIPNILNIEQIKSDINALKSGMANCSTVQDTKESKDKEEDLQKQITILRDQFEEYISNQTDHDDIQNLKRKLESLNSKQHELEINLEDFNMKLIESAETKKQNVDSNKFLEIKLFEEFKSQIIKEFTNVNENFMHLRKLVDNILDALKNKASYKDIKALEEDLLTKMEDFKLSSCKKFAERVETIKNLKYLDQQIKKIINIYIKKNDKTENWLLAKKPLNANLCASCESYIGDLKDNSLYVPWNKYPNREGDKLYRLGNGFSKMLQMIQTDENDKKNVGVNSPSQGDFNINAMSRTDGNSGSSSNIKAPDTSGNKKNLPIIRNTSQMNHSKSHFNSMTNINNNNELEAIKQNENGNNANTIEVGEEDETDLLRRPKITKIFRVNNKENN